MYKKIKTAQQMDIFARQRQKDKGTPARAGEVFFDKKKQSFMGYKKIESVSKLKSVLSRFGGVDREIALGVLRRVSKSEGFLPRRELAESVYAVIATKHPSVKMIQVLDIILDLAEKGALKSARRNIVKK